MLYFHFTKLGSALELAFWKIYLSEFCNSGLISAASRYLIPDGPNCLSKLVVVILKHYSTFILNQVSFSR